VISLSFIIGDISYLGASVIEDQASWSLDGSLDNDSRAYPKTICAWY